MTPKIKNYLLKQTFVIHEMVGYHSVDKVEIPFRITRAFSYHFSSAERLFCLVEPQVHHTYNSHHITDAATQVLKNFLNVYLSAAIRPICFVDSDHYEDAISGLKEYVHEGKSPQKLLREARLNYEDEVTHEWVLDFESKIRRHLKKTFIFPEGTQIGDFKATTDCKFTVRNINITYKKDPGFFYVCLYVRPKDCSGEVNFRQWNSDFHKPAYDLIDFNNFFLIHAIETFFSYLSLGKEKIRVLVYKDPQEWYRMNGFYKNNRLT